jgi:hypothetical protein
MEDQIVDREGDEDLGRAQQPHWSRFSLKGLLIFVMLLSVAIVAYQFCYQMGRTIKVLKLIDEGRIPPKPPKK